MTEWIWFGVGFLVLFFAMLAAHWMPRALPDDVTAFVQNHRKELILRYAIGVAGILATFTAARLAVGDWHTPAMLGGLVVAAGSATIAGHFIDWLMELVKHDRMTGVDDAER